jgi:hypothetical protein
MKENMNIEIIDDSENASKLDKAISRIRLQIAFLMAKEDANDIPKLDDMKRLNYKNKLLRDLLKIKNGTF